MATVQLSLKKAVEFIDKNDLNKFYLSKSSNDEIIFKEKTWFSTSWLGRCLSSDRPQQLGDASMTLLKYIAKRSLQGKSLENGEESADSLMAYCKAKLNGDKAKRRTTSIKLHDAELYAKVKKAYKKTQNTTSNPYQPQQYPPQPPIPSAPFNPYQPQQVQPSGHSLLQPQPTRSDYDRLIDFYLNKQPNAHRNTLQTVQSYTPAELERNHDFIDWLFPTSSRGTDETAPLVTQENYPVLLANEAFRAALLTTFKHVMLPFYGLLYDENQKQVVQGANYTQRSPNLIRPDNHNFLRLTRILECMKMFGFYEEATALYNWLISNLYLDDANRRIIEQSQTYKTPFTFWANTMGMRLPLFNP